MLMKEAQKLDGDDVINIKIDVNQIEEVVKDDDGSVMTKTTYNYTASALAIKYTEAIPVENIITNHQDISDAMLITKREEIKDSNTLKIIAIILSAIAVGGGIYTVSAIVNDL